MLLAGLGDKPKLSDKASLCVFRDLRLLDSGTMAFNMVEPLQEPIKWAADIQPQSTIIGLIKAID
nr:hypothetical protein [Pseudomonas alcaligenes]